mgnify:FL=1
MPRKINATLDVPHWPAPRRLARGGLHRMAWRDMGRGEPWLLLHGGPGSGCSPALLAPFDLARQRVIAPDQRGAGDSRPSGRTAANHLAALVADLEALRRHLGLERWSLLGGSWGTVVALAYARQHPDHVARLVLRGAFGLTRREVGGLLLPSARPGKRVAQGDWPVPHGAALPQALSGLSQLLQSGAVTVPSLQAGRGWALRERRDALHGLRRSLRHLSGKDATAQRRLWAGLQRQQRRALAQLPRPRATPADRQAQARYRLQAHYLRHRGFVRPGELDAAVLALARHGVPVDWVHGRFDAICPPGNSRRWAAMGRPHARLQLVASGHLGAEPAMLRALRYCVAAAVGDSD